MRELVRFELGKILHRKFVWIPLVIMLVFGAFMTLNYFMNQVATPDGRQLTGREANESMIETGRRYEGPLTDQVLEEILDKEKPIPNNRSGEYAFAYGDPLWSWAKDNFQNEYGNYYGMTVKEAYTDRGIHVNAGFFKSWDQFVNSLSSFMMFFGALMVIAAAGIFSDEYGSGMDALILTSRYGKNKCIKAKILAAFLFTAGCCGVLFAIHLLCMFINFGLEGMNTSAQLMLDVPYDLTCGQVVLWEMAIWLLAMLITVGVVLIISVYTQSPFVSLICGLVFYFGPICILMLGLPQKILGLFPLMATMEEIITTSQFQVFGAQIPYQYIYVVEFAITAGAAFFLCKKGFAKHQVK